MGYTLYIYFSFFLKYKYFTVYIIIHAIRRGKIAEQFTLRSFLSPDVVI